MGSDQAGDWPIKFNRSSTSCPHSAAGHCKRQVKSEHRGHLVPYLMKHDSDIAIRRGADDQCAPITKRDLTPHWAQHTRVNFSLFPPFVYNQTEQRQASGNFTDLSRSSTQVGTLASQVLPQNHSILSTKLTSCSLCIEYRKKTNKNHTHTGWRGTEPCPPHVRAIRWTHTQAGKCKRESVGVCVRNGLRMMPRFPMDK